MLEFPVGTQQDAYEFYDKLISKLLVEEGIQAVQVEDYEESDDD